MEIKGTKTEKALKEALDAELRTSFRYQRIAEAARREDMKHVADVFDAIARNELEHAHHEFEFLGGIGDIREIIRQAADSESEEASSLYPEAAKVAEADGFPEIAGFFRRIGEVEGRHESHFRLILDQLAKGIPPEGHTVEYSSVEMARVMQPEQANPAGFIHGGELMKFMDDAASVVAARHSGTSIVTGGVEDIKFLMPVKIGDLLIARGKVIFTSRASMEVKIEVDAEATFSDYTRERRPVLSALFVMVAVGSTGKPIPVPRLIYSTEEEERLFEEGRVRHEARRAQRRQ